MKQKANVPLFFNPDSGSADAIVSELQRDDRLQCRAVRPRNLAAQIDAAVADGSKRILVSGGDGTLALAASRLAGKNTILGIIPAGTLNHFAQRLGIPRQLEDFVEVALNGKAMPIDVGYVNDRLFINTSSVGAYTVFVRNRNHLQKRLPYFFASIIAGSRRLIKFRKIRVMLHGEELHTPLVFVGVMERQLQLPSIGQKKEGGKRSLHLIAVESGNRTELALLVFKSLFFGIDPLSRGSTLQNQLVEEITLRYRHESRRVRVALDGELIWLRAPLHYRYAKDEIVVSVPCNE